DRGADEADCVIRQPAANREHEHDGRHAAHHVDGRGRADRMVADGVDQDEVHDRQDDRIPHRVVRRRPLAEGHDVAVSAGDLLAGFLLYRPFVAARLHSQPPPRTAAFWWRRVLRIYPAYWLALGALVIIGGIEVHGFTAWVRFVGLVHIYWPSTVFGPVAQSW